MKKINMSIEIVSSSFSELSSMSAKSRETVLEVLAKHYTDAKITIINNITDLEMLVDRRPDLVFLGMSYVPKNSKLKDLKNNKIWLSEYFDKNNITYTGSTQKSHYLESNKELAKDIIKEAGLNTADFCVIKSGNIDQTYNLPEFPLFVKPTDKGGGTGIDNNSLVYNIQDLKSKVTSIYSKYGSDSLIEQYLPGREFSVAVLKGENSYEYSLMPIELIAPLNVTGARFLSAEIKRADTEQFKEVTENNIIQDITTLALDVFIALGARDYGRIDIRLDEMGIPHFLEANLIPSLMKNYGNFPKACLVNINLNYEDLLLRIVNLALNRNSVLNSEDFELQIKSKPILATI